MKRSFLILLLVASFALAQDEGVNSVRLGGRSKLTRTETLAVQNIRARQDEVRAAQARIDADIAALISDVKVRLGAETVRMVGEEWEYK